MAITLRLAAVWMLLILKCVTPLTTNTDARRRALLGAPIAVGLTPNPSRAFLGDNTSRRQLELCLVSVLRLKYWSQTVANKLQNSESEDSRKSAYLEARLGSKAVVTGKIGGGSSYRVLSLAGLQVKESLSDLVFYSAKSNHRREMEQLKTDLIESLASIVEFDGLETTQDPSPRSTLTLSMYNDEKATFIKRMFLERTIPLTGSIVALFDADTRAQCDAYIRQYYPNELPPVPKPLPSPPASITETPREVVQ